MTDDPTVTFSSDGALASSIRPYSLVFAADFGGAGRFDRLSPVDKDNFADLMAAARPQLAIALKPPLGAGADWEFQLTFDSLASFGPAGLLGQVPAGAARLALLERIRQRRAGDIDENALTTALASAAQMDGTLAWLAAPPARVSAPGAAPTAGILDLVDEPDPSRRISADVERLAAGAGDPARRIGGAEGGRLTEVVRRLQLELAVIADALLKHEEVRRLETAWRSLKFLVDRIDFRTPVRLFALDTTREQVLMRLRQRVIEPAFDGEIPTPGLMLVDFVFKNTPVDVALLDELAQHAASLPAPLVFPLEAAFFEVKSANLIKNLPNLSGLLDGWAYAKWRTLREQSYARSLVPVLGRLLLRGLHDGAAGGDGAQIQEKVTAASQLLWGGGELAFGACAARALGQHGWPTRMYGTEAGKVEDLPVVPNPGDADRPWGPGDATLPDRRLDEFPAIGVNLLHSIPGKDYCVLLGGVTLARPKPTAEVGKQQALLEVSVPYQQFSNVTSAWLCDQMPALRGRGATAVQQYLLFGLRELLGLTEEDDPESVVVGVGEIEGAAAGVGSAARTQVQVRITPPARIVPGGLHVDFGFQV